MSTSEAAETGSWTGVTGSSKRIQVLFLLPYTFGSSLRLENDGILQVGEGGGRNPPVPQSHAHATRTGRRKNGSCVVVFFLLVRAVAVQDEVINNPVWVPSKGVLV